MTFREVERLVSDENLFDLLVYAKCIYHQFINAPSLTERHYLSYQYKSIARSLIKYLGDRD